MYEIYLDVFVASGLLQGIPLEEFDRMLQSTNPRIQDFSKGQVIYEKGQPFKEFAFILSGRVDDIEVKKSGNRALIETLYPGQVIGLMRWFSSYDKVAPTQSIAQCDCSLMFFSIQNLVSPPEPIAAYKQQLTVNLFRKVCDRVATLFDSLYFLRSRTIREKIAIFLYKQVEEENSCTIFLKYSRDELADYLYVPQPSLSRELASMKAEGIIDFYRETIRILDLEKLRSCF